jgi:hypothetical protein
VEYSKERQTGRVMAGTKEAKDLMKRSFGGNKEFKPKPSTSKLKTKAQNVFNAFIRRRDEGEPCISCGKYRKLQAGHFYSAGKHNHMRFLEDNVWGQCLPCNYYLSGNLLKYRENLIRKIGLKRVEALDALSQMRTATKNDQFLYQEIIEKYK